MITPITNYLYKQSWNKKQAIITIPMRNYQQEDLQAATSNGQMILYWKKYNYGAHFCIKKDMETKWKDINVIKRVGFCAFVIDLVN